MFGIIKQIASSDLPKLQLLFHPEPLADSIMQIAASKPHPDKTQPQQQWLFECIGDNDLLGP